MKITDDVDGLIHVSEISDQRIATPADVLSVGQKVQAKIIGINVKEYLGNLLAPFVSGSLIIGVFFLFYQAPSHWPAWVSLGGGLTSYLAMFLYLEKETVSYAVRSVFNKEF